ncbi:hypothetical protein BaRGS_00024312 [Batillaria attramentaria]|uniref:LAGLIDADG homing endonuclease n=1 Tax=Batillaria attramentaria TaxID=370345 RepID=A0ABD0KBL0_9CAEN
MAPRKSPYTNVNLKGYAYITEDYVSSMVGKRFPEHIIVMAGTLRVWERSFSVLRVNGKLYLSWGECAHKLVGINTVYALAQKLRVFLYKVPHAVLYHLAENYPGLQFGQINNNPWICINSLNAIYCLGIMEPQNLTMFPKTFSLLWDIFVETAQQKVRYRSFVLLPKQGSALPEPTAGPTRKEKKRMKICFI